MPDSSVGFAVLPDVGDLNYNGVQFSSLFKTHVSGQPVPDNAQRTTKYVKWTLTVDGMVTLSVGEQTTDAAWERLREDLSAQGAVLYYTGKGFGRLVVNRNGGPEHDVAWGPKPEVIDFTPLGSSRSAMIKWQVVFHLAEKRGVAVNNPTETNGSGRVLQFNEEIGVTYDDEGYSSLSIRGTLEIPLTRMTPNSPLVAETVDAYRQKWMTIVANSIDLSRFRPTRRNFNVSRDKRTLEWEMVAEELPPMELPPYCTAARGTFSVRPLRPGLGMIPWLCSLRCSYTVRKDKPRAVAWAAFVSLLKYRMEQSAAGVFPTEKDKSAASQNKKPLSLPKLAIQTGLALGGLTVGGAALSPLIALRQLLGRQQQQMPGKKDARRAFLSHLGIDEGLYLDSKRISFEASWRLVVTLSSLLVACGFSRTAGLEGSIAWTASMRDVAGWKSWLANSLAGRDEIIIDMGTRP